jgi:pimeloyl-ACP methyl ester carboxylesterase
VNIYLLKAACRGVGGVWQYGILPALAVCGLFLANCAQAPERRFADLARQHGLQAGLVAAGAFRLRFYAKAGVVEDGPVDVYLEGDGLPWSSRTRIASDPTSRQAIGLRLMLQDAGPVLYLARPCYHGLQAQPPCLPELWTDRRYSETVVGAMAQGLRALLAVKAPDAPIRLIGYSGGGVLAMLLAERLTRVTAVVTVAANLDTMAWTRLHGFSPLHGSLNPARRPALPRRVRQVHLAGGADANVPLDLIKRAVNPHAGAEIYVLEGFDHACCWAKHWPELRRELNGTGDLCAGLAFASSRLVCRKLQSDSGA